MDAVGIFANSNDSPLTYKDTSGATLLYRIASRSNTELILESLSPTTGGGANYLGAIVSSDRQTIYWINDAKPLP